MGKGVQGNMLHPDRAGLGKLQRLEIDFLEVRGGRRGRSGGGRCRRSGSGRRLGDRNRYGRRIGQDVRPGRRQSAPRTRRTGNQLTHAALRFFLDRCRTGCGQERGLRGQQLLDPLAQHRPVVLTDGKVTPQVQKRDLPHPPTQALTPHQAIGVIPLAGHLVVRSGLSDKHSASLQEKQEEKHLNETIMAQQNETGNAVLIKSKA